MKAIEKIERATFKVVHAEVERLKPGTSLETVYRWRQAMRAGRGVSDDVKRLLIDATRGLEQPIAFVDFAPEDVAA